LVLRPQFFKSLGPSKVKTKTKTPKNGLKTGLKTKTGLKDYITGSYQKSEHNDAKIKLECVHECYI